MTDEEMAGEYAGNISGLDINTTIMVAENKTDAYRLGIYEGFLAGLKAGRPQWHYLTENPNDLPKKEGPYWVCVRDGRYKEDGSWEWTSKPLCKTGVWLNDVFCIAGGPPVIAWCEIPTFDKEIKENAD